MGFKQANCSSSAFQCHVALSPTHGGRRPLPRQGPGEGGGRVPGRGASGWGSEGHSLHTGPRKTLSPGPGGSKWVTEPSPRL